MKMFSNTPARLDLGDAAYKLIYAKESPSPSPAPLVTVGIPTFNRPELLIEALLSVWAQDDFDDFEVVVVDNASEPENVAAVLDFLKAQDRPLRYYVNEENVGVFRNWNRCLMLAKGAWVTVLNDDDLLKPAFLATMARWIARYDNLDAIICRAKLLDQRVVDARTNDRYQAARSAVVDVLRFFWRQAIMLTVGRLFWSNIAGSSLGALYRREVALALGGFNPQEAPIADYAFNVKLAAHGQFLQIRECLTEMRLQVNESMKPDTMKAILVQNFTFRSRLVTEGRVPKAWRRWPRWLLTQELKSAQALWGGPSMRAEVAEMLAIDVPRASSRWIYAIRILNGGV